MLFGDLPGGALGAGLRFDVGVDAGAVEVRPVGGGEGRGAGRVVAVHDGGHGGGEDDALDAGGEGGLEGAGGALDGGADELGAVARHPDDEGRGHVLQVAHVRHGLAPAVVAQQVEGDEFEPRDVGAVAGERLAHPVGAGEVAQAAAL